MGSNSSSPTHSPSEAQIMPGSYDVDQENQTCLAMKNAEEDTQFNLRRDASPIKELSQLFEDGISAWSQLYGNEAVIQSPGEAEALFDGALSQMALWMIRNPDIMGQVDYVLRAATARRDFMLSREARDPGRASTRFLGYPDSQGGVPYPMVLEDPYHLQRAMEPGFLTPRVLSPLAFILPNVTVNFADSPLESVASHRMSLPVSPGDDIHPSAPARRTIPLPLESLPPSPVQSPNPFDQPPAIMNLEPAVHIVHHTEPFDGYHEFGEEEVMQGIVLQEGPPAFPLPPIDHQALSSPLAMSLLSSPGTTFSSPLPMSAVLSNYDFPPSPPPIHQPTHSHTSTSEARSSRFWDAHFEAMRAWRVRSQEQGSPLVAPPNSPRL